MRKQLITIATLGGHSSLEICAGAKAQGLPTCVIVQRGREKTYAHYFRTLIDSLIEVNHFRELTSTATIQQLKKVNALLIPHRYCQVYCDLEKLENNFFVPVFGNKRLLSYEERVGKKHQYQILDRSRVAYPKRYTKPQDIDRLVIVKVSEATRKYERAFFFAATYEDFQKRSKELVVKKMISDAALKEAVIEEYIVGAQVNFNFFYSPLKKRLELLGTDARRQTNIDGWMRIPAQEQLALSSYAAPSYIETGHVAVTVKESLLEKAFVLGEAVIKAAEAIEPPGIIGPFALQCGILPGPPEEQIIVYDLSLRMPGSPGIGATPYSSYLFGRPVSMGERIAMEIKMAVQENQMKKIIT